LWSLVAWIPPSALLSYPRKQLPSAFWQADSVCLNCFGLFCECVCASTALSTLWFQHSEIKPRFCHLLLIWCDWEILCRLCGIAQKCKSQSHSLRFMNIFGPHLAQNLW
jgi:hypothetical protein